MTVHEEGRAKGPARREGTRARSRAGSRSRRTRAAVVIVVTVLAGSAALAGCAPSGMLVDGRPRSAAEAIRIVPDDGARGVGARERLEVRVPDGRLQRVEVRRAGDVAGRAGDVGRQPLAGRISPDGLTWRPTSGRLALGSKYTVDVVALDGEGRRSARHTTFTTFVPPHRFIGFYTPESNTRVGTGMIVSLTFNRRIADRAAVERGIRVTARPAVEIGAHWFGSRRLDFRPRTRWKPGTVITVDLRLRDVKAGPDAYGTQRKTIRYRVGRDQISTIDAARHTMTVRRSGRVLARLPVTAGNAANPTYNGKMVILARQSVTRMDGDTVGFGGEYDIKDVPHAMRLTRSGTFLHGNYWAPPAIFGGLNTSHGCVGLKDIRGGGPDTPAGWLFAHSIVGDTVEVRNSQDRTVAPDNGLGGWNMSWARWRAGSALR
ncbi:Ig-like domain-containing protein [Streptomyces sp. NPDC050636]|uniref:L,D-transpeptidase n=1 Tax=Streptomyces sp. NPDC050636 TaxID=3154510 RepID=UPI0034422537